MDETPGRSYHPSLIDMAYLRRLRTPALCFAFLGMAACSGDDNAAPPASDGSAGSGGGGGSAGSAGAPTAGDSSHPDVTVTPDSAGDVTAADGDGGPLNCPSLADGGMGDGGDGGEGGVDPGFVFPPTLPETGLYCDFATGVIAPSNKLFRPKYELWSDGAVKTRWFYLPPGKTVDTSDMDHWSMPVGAKFWKEFKYNGKRIETRLIVRVALGTATDFRYAAYKWNAMESAATLWNSATGEKDTAPLGPGAEPLQHDIPSEAECGRCHGPLPEHILGFSAIQLSHSLGGETITTLAAAKLLSAAPEAAAGFIVPGNAVEEPALGFLHANCGNCHNETPTGSTVGLTPPYMVRLLVGNTTVQSTNTYKTAVNVIHSLGLQLSADAGVGVYRIQGGNPDVSEIHYRMSVRGGVNQQMPPIDTKITTPDGLTIIENWIKALPPPSDAGDGG